MQSVDIEDNDEEKQEMLPGEDVGKPFSPPSGTKDTIPKDHQSLETGIDSHEWYDEGRSGAAEVDDPGSRGIADYKPSGSPKPQNGAIKVIKKAKK